jgi:site-specific DNA recombinase
MQLNKLGVKVETVEQPLDMTNPDNVVLFSLYLTLPQAENKKNSIRTTEGSRRARLDGCWTGTAPKGYINCRTESKKSTLKPSPDAPMIVEAFNRMSSGAYSADEVRRWLNSKGMKLGKQAFLNLIRNPAYVGKIVVKPYELNKQPGKIVIGLHPGLVVEDVFYKSNDILAGRKRNMKFHEDKSDLHPLKGFLKCPVHGISLTAYGARSGTKRIHHYYLCTKCRSEQRHRIEDVHQ